MISYRYTKIVKSIYTTSALKRNILEISDILSQGQEVNQTPFPMTRSKVEVVDKKKTTLCAKSKELTLTGH